MEKSYITGIDLEVENGRLRAYVDLVSDGSEPVNAELPQRELSTLLPRTILLGDGKTIDGDTFETMRSTLSRLVSGRAVRTWEYKESVYCGFLPWRNVNLEAEKTTHAP